MTAFAAFPEHRVVVDTRSDLLYGSYYLEGLSRTFGWSNVRFATGGFPRRYEDAQPFAFRVERADMKRSWDAWKVYISAGDRTTIDRSALAWADVYGKVNLANDCDHPKLRPLGPSFPVRVRWGRRPWSSRVSAVAASTKAAAANLRRGRLSVHGIGRDRADLDRYCPIPGRDDYLFYLAWPWQRHQEVNGPRARFIEAAQQLPNVRFEGGFAPRPRGDVAGVELLTAERTYRLSDYLDRTAASLASFQCPAVHGCLGWKLGEFLALGKAIVAIEINQRLPAPLRHGEEVWRVADDVDAYREALEHLAGDPAGRRNLERGARAYFERHVTPEASVARLCADLRPDSPPVS
jgi:hypothetical protein